MSAALYLKKHKINYTNNDENFALKDKNDVHVNTFEGMSNCNPEKHPAIVSQK